MADNDNIIKKTYILRTDTGGTSLIYDILNYSGTRAARIL